MIPGADIMTTLLPPLETTMSEGFDTPEKIAIWCAAHEARCTAYWNEQQRHNDRLETRMQDQDRRLTAVEKRVIWFTGAAAGIGSIIGAIIANLPVLG